MPFPLQQHLWSLLVDGHAQLFLLREEKGVRPRRESEGQFLEQGAKLRRLLVRERMGVGVHARKAETFNGQCSTFNASTSNSQY